MTYPVTLEAVLRAEIALFPQLLAVRALQRACVILTVCAATFTRGVSGHVVLEPELQCYTSGCISVEKINKDK